MEDVAAKLEALTALVESQSGELRRLRDQVEAQGQELRPLRQTLARLRPDRSLSKLECARRLGVSVSDTLQPAIDARLVHTVRRGKREYITVDEFMRLRSEGLGRPARKKKQTSQQVARHSATGPDLRARAAALAQVAATEYGPETPTAR